MKRKKSVSYMEGLLQRLKDPGYAKGYLTTCLESEEGDAEEAFLFALRDVAKAHGFKYISEKAKLGRESPYKVISKTDNPKLSTLISLLDALGFKLSIEIKKAV